MKVMGKTIDSRIADSFVGDESASEAKEYADKVYAAWKDVSSSLSRNAALVFILIAVFELLAYQKESIALTVGIFTFTNVPVVQIVLPVIVALVVYDGYRLTARWVDLQYAYQDLVEKYAPKLSENELDILIRPSLPAFWGIGISSSYKSGQFAEKFINVTNGIVALAAAFALPLGFAAQAYYQLFGKFGYQNILLWLSVAITTMLTAFSLIYIATWAVEAGRGTDPQRTALHNVPTPKD